jgi:hypothetical protein
MRSRVDEPLRVADQSSVQAILSFRKKCTVKGGISEGRRPFVNFMGARYSSDVLGGRHDLVGKEVWIVNHLEDDCRVALCSTLNGSSLGPLRAAPPWHSLPHSMSVRQAIKSLVRKRMFHIASGADAVETLLDFVEGQSDSKLPIHPAYLEARRILSQQTRDAGELVLAAARKKITEEATTPDSSSHIRADSKRPNSSESPLPSLPPRRMAASK